MWILISFVEMFNTDTDSRYLLWHNIFKVVVMISSNNSGNVLYFFLFILFTNIFIPFFGTAKVKKIKKTCIWLIVSCLKITESKRTILDRYLTYFDLFLFSYAKSLNLEDMIIIFLKAFLIGCTKVCNYQEPEEFTNKFKRTHKCVDGLPTLTLIIIL